MNGWDPLQIERLVYLTILGTLLVSFALLRRQVRVGQMVQQVVLWVLLVAGVAVAIELFRDAPGLRSSQQQLISGEALELTRGRDGAFRLTLEVTGPEGGLPQPVNFIIDTGATDIVLTRADAEALGYEAKDLAFLGTARTANGVVRTATVWLDRVDLGEGAHRRVRALVNEGELHVSLLGMAYLDRFSRIEMTRDRLRLEF